MKSHALRFLFDTRLQLALPPADGNGPYLMGVGYIPKGQILRGVQVSPRTLEGSDQQYHECFDLTFESGVLSSAVMAEVFEFLDDEED
jgi:hypothetical protein